MHDHPNNWLQNKLTSESSPSEEADFLNLQKLTGLSDLILRILGLRGIGSFREVSDFISPRRSNLLSPSLMPNIGIAAERLKKAYLDREKVLIYGDYDSDGVISTALSYNFLTRAGFNASYYIPDRFEEGYDISTDFIEKTAIPQNFDLIICVDCGTNALEVRDLLSESKTAKIDVIVCDHHEPLKDYDRPEKNKPAKETGKKNPESSSYIVVNPKLPGSEYPFRYLSGAGVVFKFIIYFLSHADETIKSAAIKGFSDVQQYLKSMIDLVAISTVADVMPITGENRIIVYFGLKNLSATCNKGLKKLIDKNFTKNEGFNTYDAGFIIAPRLNASGRMKNANKSIELLIDGLHPDTTLEEIVADLEAFNTERQRTQEEVLKEILGILTESRALPSEESRIFICSSPAWSEGILGIAASNLVRKINRPVILFKNKGGILKGSGRSTGGFNLYENLEKFRSYFIKFGGHSQACGITIDESRYGEFKSEIEKYARSAIKQQDLEKKFYYDAEIGFTQIDARLINELEKLKPFGIENPKPVFRTDTCLVTDEPYVANSRAKDAVHIFFKLKNSGKIFEAAMFNIDSGIADSRQKAGFLNLPEKGAVINILYSIEKKMIGQETGNNGEYSIQLVLLDFYKQEQ
jgi:single-stranded-DNA-specific exonuclease